LIIGPGWAFLGLLAVGLAAFSLIPGCGIVVVDEAPSGQVRLDAPPLVEVDPGVEARTAAVATLSPGRATRQVRRGALRIRNTGCDGVPTGSGFALDPKILIAQRDVLPGAGALKVAPRNGRARALDAARVYRLGEFGIAQVERQLPHMLPLGRSIALGASVAVVGYPLSAKPRLLPGVVVDSIAGAPFGVRGRVMRLTSTLRHDEPGGPVIDAKGRIVAVAFATDPRTGFAVAIPIRTLRSLVAARALDALPSCEGT
jgi:S1-C subfamily serine protease